MDSKTDRLFHAAADAVTIRAKGIETGNAYALLECTLPPYAAGLAQHLHRRTTETIYILHGALACTLDDRTLVANPGSLIVVPPGVAHRFWNPTGKPTGYLTLLSPPGVETFAATLLDQALHTGTGTTAHTLLTTQGPDFDHFTVSPESPPANTNPQTPP